jgi:hypothetical protein
MIACETFRPFVSDSYLRSAGPGCRLPEKTSSTDVGSSKGLRQRVQRTDEPPLRYALSRFSVEAGGSPGRTDERILGVCAYDNLAAAGNGKVERAGEKPTHAAQPHSGNSENRMICNRREATFGGWRLRPGSGHFESFARSLYSGHPRVVRTRAHRHFHSIHSMTSRNAGRIPSTPAPVPTLKLSI